MSKYVIIGGVAGGATAAARLRRIDEQSEIIMIERGKHISYANCGLPYYIGGVINEREKLLVQTPESFSARFNIDVRVENEVVEINREKKYVKIKDLANNREYVESYDKLILSPGAEPIKPPISGINDKAIFTVRNVTDTDRIMEYIDENKPERVVVVGAGFIGLEMAENFFHRGVFVTIVEMAEQVMTPLDYEMAAEVHQHLKSKNVEFYLSDSVVSFNRAGDKLYVKLKSGRELQSDMVIMSIGVKPDSKLAKDCNLQLGERGGIVVDKHLTTSDPDIYAVGDAIEFTNPIVGIAMPTYLAGPANKQARIVADNIVYGNQRTYKGAIATAIAKIFDITVASCGMPEKALKRYNIPYLSSITHGASHAGYYPGAMPMTLKIVFAPDTGKLYGAQIVGYEGVDKRIDTIATVLQHNGTIYDLQEIEHAYAPPFSSAKDPVNIAGFVAENIIKKQTRVIKWDELLQHNSDELFLLDVRTADEFMIGSFDGAVNIPLNDIRSRMSEIPRDKKIILFCGVGLRGYVAERILAQHGYTQVFNLNGGYKTYEHATQKQSNEDIFESDFIGKDDNIYKKTPDAIKPLSGMIKTITVDACGLQCPGPILKLKNEMENAGEGDRIIQTSNDPGFYKDVQAWCNMTGNKLLELSQDKGIITATIEKGMAKPAPAIGTRADNKTIIVFSDDMDKALASFVIANGASSTGKKVTMFFTFWGLNVVKRSEKPSVKKDFMGRMFGMMMPSDSTRLKLSKMHMMGMGSMMMRGRMKSKKVDSLETMIATAVENGVEMIACQMSMDIMGVKAEELIDGVKIGGVASYLEEAEKSNLNLFI